MARRKTHTPLNVLINNRLVGRLMKETSGAIKFQYVKEWLEWEHSFAVSLSLSLRKTAYRGEPVVAVFDNLLPDNPNIRRIVAERTGAGGTDAYSLLEQIGRDCVGAMQFLPDDVQADARMEVRGEPVTEEDIERILANLARAPLGIDPEHEFRISVAGVQEKTALLFHHGQWMRPLGTTPTTHILKPQIGEVPTAFGLIDMAASVDNEHYCLKLLEAFGLHVNQTEIQTFGARRVLVVERFDRLWQNDGRLLRLPQEDFCQALGVPSTRKYQATVEGRRNGPSIVDITSLLQASDESTQDRAAFFKAQLLFWLIGATDGHAKNFSIFLSPGGGFKLTPFYDVLSAQQAFDANQIPRKSYKLAMSFGKSRKYRILEITGRHFVETGKEAGLGPTIIREAITSVLEAAGAATDKALAEMPDDFSVQIHESVKGVIVSRLGQLEAALDNL
jgi:serine/threonine-protein kinase HipA